jgi:hypothetical protein
MNPFYVVLQSSEISALTNEGVLVMDLNDTILPSIYFPQIVEASRFPQLTSTKKYLVLYSTDHGSGAGGIAWGDADSERLLDFTEKGVIWDGHQSETPHLQLVPNDPNGEYIHLYFHTNQTDPANGGEYQQTHVITTGGGEELHNCSWTDRGTILGMVNPGVDEFHTGYAGVFAQSDGSFIAIHHTQGYYGSGIDQINRFGKSTNPGNSYIWTRETSRIDNTSFMPSGRCFHMSPPYFFNRNGEQYSAGLNIEFDYSVEGRKICIVKCGNSDYLPTEHITDISSIDGGENCKITGFYINPQNPDVLNIYYTQNDGDVYSNPGTQMYYTTWDLRNLD